MASILGDQLHLGVQATMSLEMDRKHRLCPFVNSTNCAPSFVNIAKIHGSDSFPPEIQNKVMRQRKGKQRKCSEKNKNAGVKSCIRLT